MILEQKPRALTTETKSEGKRSALLINTVDTQQIYTPNERVVVIPQPKTETYKSPRDRRKLKRWDSLRLTDRRQKLG